MRSIISDKGAIGNQFGTDISHSLRYFLTDGWVVSHDGCQHGLKVAAGEGVCLSGGGFGEFGLVAGGQHGDQVGCLKAGFGCGGDGCHGILPLLLTMEWSIQVPVGMARGFGRNGSMLQEYNSLKVGGQCLKGKTV